MLLGAIIFAAALAQSAGMPTERGMSDVAYAELAAGNPNAAVRKLEAPSVDQSSTLR